MFAFSHTRVLLPGSGVAILNKPSGNGQMIYRKPKKLIAALNGRYGAKPTVIKCSEPNMLVHI
jgi:hypothetical protein